MVMPTPPHTEQAALPLPRTVPAVDAGRAAGLWRKLTSASFVTAALAVVSGMLLGRLSGLVRELVLAARLGVSGDADIAILGITLPDFLTALLVGGAAGAVIVPEYHRRRAEEGIPRANLFVWRSFLAIGALTALLAAALATFASPLVYLLAPGLSAESAQRAAEIVRVSLIGFPLAPLAAVTSAALQARGKVIVPAFGTVLFNGVLIATLAIAVTPGRLMLLGWGIVLAAGARLLSQLAACYRHGLFDGAGRETFAPRAIDRRLALRYVQALGAVGLTALLPVISRAIASATVGGIAQFSYAYKLIELPLGLCGAILSMVLFPRFSRLMSDGNFAGARTLAARSFAGIVAVSLPAAVLLAGWGLPVVELLFGRNRLNSEDLARIAELVQLGALALPAILFAVLTTGLFHARRDTATPFRVSLLAAAAHAGLAWMASRTFGLHGVMVALAATSWLHAASLIVLFRRGDERKVLPRFRPVQIAALAALTGAAAAITCVAIGANAHVAVFAVLALALFPACVFVCRRQLLG